MLCYGGYDGGVEAEVKGGFTKEVFFCCHFIFAEISWCMGNKQHSKQREFRSTETRGG